MKISHSVALAALLSLAPLAGSLAPAAAQGASGRCTHDALSVDGTPVAATFCVTAQNAGSNPPSLAVTESFRSPKGSFDRQITVDELPGTAQSRSVDDVALDRLGSTKVLHLTLLQEHGAVTLEHALLLPGARVLK